MKVMGQLRTLQTLRETQDSLSSSVIRNFAAALLLVGWGFALGACGTHHSSQRNHSVSEVSTVASVFRSSRTPALASIKSSSAVVTDAHLVDETSTAMVERNLRQRGLRFGTDGTPGGLLAYVKYKHRLVPATEARAGDVVFFGPRCADHIGLVEAVEPNGRLTFREIREGSLRRSHLHAALVDVRRGGDGRILNSFLRAKTPSDQPETRYFAGQLLCAVGQIRTK